MSTYLSIHSRISGQFDLALLAQARKRADPKEMIRTGDALFNYGSDSVKCLVCEAWFRCEAFCKHLNSWKHYKNQVKRVIYDIDEFLKRATFDLNAMD